MKRAFCLIVLALLTNVCFASIRNFYSSPADERAFVIVIVSLLVLPMVFSVVGYWTGKTGWKVVGALFTIPIAILGLLLSSFALELAVVPLLIASVNIFLLMSSRAAKNIL